METPKEVERDCNSCARHHQAAHLECQKQALWDHINQRMIPMFKSCLESKDLKHWLPKK